MEGGPDLTCIMLYKKNLICIFILATELVIVLLL